MAYVKLLENQSSLRAAYLVDAAVGRGCPNRKDDVYLVQFLLNALWGKTSDGTVIGGDGPAPAIDGICGARTVNAILVFQKWYWRVTPGGFTDGRVEPLPPGRSVGLRHNNPYTIIGLNANFGVVFGIERHAVICKEPNFPSELKQKLFISN
ncbi:MAG: hypothetical protein H0T56_01265 [Pseudaminobacter sp.]|nr:hypothetical protein [Pseudaminobacter sp.]